MEATEEETRRFLKSEFIQLSEEFCAVQVNMKRIAIEIAILNSFEDKQKEVVFYIIKDYCHDLVTENNPFKTNI